VNAWLLAIVGLIYLAVAVGYGRRREWGMALAFVAYAMANLGFILADRK